VIGARPRDLDGRAGLLTRIHTARRCRLRSRRSCCTPGRSWCPTGAATRQRKADQAAPGRRGGRVPAIGAGLSERHPGAADWSGAAQQMYGTLLGEHRLVNS
jgi:hypothetical protein